VPPATGVALAVVLVMTMSATRLTVTGTELLLLPGTGSVVPTGGATVAVLSKVPVAPGATVTWKVMVATCPTVKLLVPEMVEPAAVPVMLPLGAILVIVPKPVGKVSVQVALVTGLGPLLPITMV
jgi:hypothetical protein